jgi:DNA-binding beta-propeller fold protein YncE
MKLPRVYIPALLGLLFLIVPADAYYQYDSEWGREGEDAGQMSQGVGSFAIDHNNLVYVADGGERIQVFTADGTFLNMWPVAYDPEDLMIDAAGNVYLLDMRGGIHVYTSDGQYLTEFIAPGEEVGYVDMPSHIVVDASTNSHVVDKVFTRIQKFDAQGNLLPGTSTYETDVAIGGIAVDERGNIYVSALIGNVVRKYSPEFNLLAEFNGGGGGFSHPMDMVIDQFGNLVVCDAGNSRLQILTLDGAFIAEFSHDPGPEFHFEPSGIRMDSEGSLYVVAGYDGRIVKFSPTPSVPPVVADPTSQRDGENDGDERDGDK